jgi:hypothetical protein
MGSTTEIHLQDRSCLLYRSCVTCTLLIEVSSQEEGVDR